MNGKNDCDRTIDLLNVPRHISRKTLREFAKEVLSLCGRSDTGLCIAFINDQDIQKLNREFRRIDSPTDVLSFPTDDSHQGGYLGDIAVSLTTAERQAEELGHSVKEELLMLVAHGIVHLCGYDHETDGGEMAGLEKKIELEVAQKYK
jgi:probable rRNA maturation factor